MYKDQKSHPVYEIKLDVSNASRIYEYVMLREYLEPGKEVLEVGCNTGIGLDIIHSYKCKVYGIDVIPTLDTFLKEKYADKEGIETEIVKEGDLGFSDKKFDYIIANNFIEHIPNPVFYLEKFKERLVPGGVLFLTTVNRELRLFPWQEPYNEHHFTEYNFNSIDKLVRKVFNNIEITGVVKSPPFFPDYKKIAFKKKWDLGVKLPIKLFLSQMKTKFLGNKDLEMNIMSNSEDINVEFKFESYDETLFQEAFDCIRIEKSKRGSWSEIFVIARK